MALSWSEVAPEVLLVDQKVHQVLLYFDNLAIKTHPNFEHKKDPIGISGSIYQNGIEEKISPLKSCFLTVVVRLFYWTSLKITRQVQSRKYFYIYYGIPVLLDIYLAVVVPT